MTLRAKILLLVGATFVGLALVVSLILWLVVFHGLAALEQASVRRDVGRATRALDAEGQALELTVADWAEWDETYRFVLERHDEYARVNLNGGTLRTLNLRIFAMASPTGEVIAGLTADPDGEVKELAASLASEVVPLCRPFLGPRGERGRHGVHVIGGEALVVAVRQITRNGGEGPGRGALIMARPLDSRTLGRLGTTLDLGLAVRRIGEWAAGSDFAAVAPRVEREGRAVVMPPGGRTIAGYGVLSDLADRPSLLLRVTEPRTLGPQARRIAWYLAVALLVAVVASAVAIEVLVARFFVARLASLDLRMREIGSSGDLSARVEAGGRDEVARLAGSINSMLGALERTEATLRESEQRYRVIVEEQTELICRWRPDGALVLANQAYCRFLDSSLEQLLGTSFIPDGEEGQEIARKVAALTPESPSCGFVRVYTEPDGTRRWVQWSNRAIFTGTGVVVEHQAVGRDVTPQRASEEALKSCERTARAILNGPTETAFLTDLAGVVLATNDATATRLEITVAKLIGSRVHDHLGRQAAASWRARAEAVIGSGKPARWEDERGGRTIESVLVPVLDGAGAVRQLATYARDVTDQRRAEAAERRLRDTAMRAEVLERISRQLAEAQLEGHESLDQIAQLAAEHLGDLCLFHLLSDDGRLLLPVTFAHRDREEDAKLRKSGKLLPHPYAGGLGEEVIVTGEPLCLPETSSMAVAGNLFPEIDAYLSRFPSVGLLCTPILMRGRTAGLMTTIREITSAPLNGDDVSFASEIATRAGIAIGQLNLFNELQKELQERARVEEALRDSQAVFRQITQSLKEVLWIRETETERVTYVSPGYEAIWGRSCASLYQDPRSFLEGVHPDDRRRVQEETLGSRGPTTRTHEYRVVRPSGDVRWVLARRFVAPGEAGSGPRLISMVEDITERKQMEEQSRRLEAQLRLLARRLDAAREEERRSLALWIHDEIGQMLTAVRMDLSWVHRKLPPRNQELKARLVELQGLLEENIGAVQRVCAELRPSLLEDLGLKAAFEWQLEQFSRRTGITAELDVRVADEQMDTDVSLVLFRILQEALTNIARHAQATRTLVRLDAQEGDVTLSVEDNGRGIREEEAAGPGALGILGMRERIAAHGGTLEIRARGGGGTSVVVTIPYDRTA